MKKIRINELAREMEVKAQLVLEKLVEFGLGDKKTHSSSIDDDVAEKLRRFFRGEPEVEQPGPVEASPASAAPELPPAAVEIALVSRPVPMPVAAELEPAPAAPVAALPGARTAPPVAPELPEAKPAPRVPGAPVRPPLAAHGTPAGGLRQVSPAAPRPAPPVGAPRPSPEAPSPRPGQILSTPRPPMAPAPGPRSVPVPAAPAATVAPPAQPAPQAPSASAATTTLRTPMRPGLAGQPAQRPVVPPRPDLVAKLAQPGSRGPAPGSAPGSPAAAPRPGMPSRPAAPVPGQPIYRGPIRPGQPLVARPGVRVAVPFRPGARPMHPTARGARLEPIAPPVEEQRRARTAPRAPQRQRTEPEEKMLRQVRKEVSAGPPPISRQITISEGMTVKELSEKLDVKASLVIKKLVDRSIFATINQTLDSKLANEIAREFGASTSTISFEEEAMQEVQTAEDATDLVKRAPVVTVMGHVDHGKTSLLDAVRETRVAEREAGGITQHIGAYHVDKGGRKIVFIDTPGHEAFTRMRARGARVTDVVVLVVAADDGVMPQTIEAIDHARAAKVPIVVAINKIDKPEGQPERIKQQLADRGLLAEDWGGETVMVPVSARQKTNLDLLLEMILLVSDLQDLKANPTRPATGAVLEAKLDRGRGPVATVLVRNGTLRVGDFFICGSVFGRVRAMINDRGLQVRECESSMPVEVLGLESLPEAGDDFQVVTDTAKAKQIVLYREAKTREAALAKSSRLTLEQLHQQMKAGEVKELPIILKADVGGSAEVLTDTLQKLSTDKVKIRVIHSGVGAINESDVLLASASNAIVIGFNVRPERTASDVAEREKVDIRLHTIIYELTDEIKRAMVGLLAPVFREIYRGKAEVRQVFRVSKVGMVAGSIVLDGGLTRDSQVRLLRDNAVVHTGRIGSLRRFKDDVSEVKSGMECGITIENYSDVKEGDIIEGFVTERVATEVAG